MQLSLEEQERHRKYQTKHNVVVDVLIDSVKAKKGGMCTGVGKPRPKQIGRICFVYFKCLKLIICYISSGATNIAEVSSGFHQADWFCFGLFVYTCLSELDSNNKRADENVSSI